MKCGVSRSQGQEEAFSRVDLLALLAVLVVVVCMQLPALAHNKGNNEQPDDQSDPREKTFHADRDVLNGTISKSSVRF